MEFGSKEWMIDYATTLSMQAQPQLIDIVDAACVKHGVAKIEISQTDAARVACVISDTQAESFRLGLRLSMQLAMRLAVGLPEHWQEVSQDPKSQPSADQSGVVGTGGSPPAADRSQDEENERKH